MLCVPRHERRLGCHVHNAFWLRFLRSLRIATLGTRQVHLLAEFLRCTTRLETLDVGVIVHQEPIRGEDANSALQGELAHLEHTVVSFGLTLSILIVCSSGFFAV